METTAIILAAGESKRMKSQMHKALHAILGLPMIDYILRAAQGAGVARQVMVVGHRAEQLEEYLGERVLFARQDLAKGYGTAKAAEAAADMIGEGPVFVILSDSPLVRPETLRAMLFELEQGATACVMTSLVEDPTGYGRILRDDSGNIAAIVEHADATQEQRGIREINASVLCCMGPELRSALAMIGNDNAKGEYYLTDAVAALYAQGKKVAAVRADFTEGVGINDRVQLAQASRIMQQRINEAHMLDGVTIVAPEQTFIGPDVMIGQDSAIYPGCMLMGKTKIGDGVMILPGCRLEDTVVGDGAVLDNVVSVQATVGQGSKVGPFTQLRPQSVIGDNCRIGDFVEIKNASLGEGTHVSHLTYVGDADLGARVNLGCGVVFSNYDGKNKFRSQVADDAFIGGNVNLISPVSVGEHAYVAAGTTVTCDVPGYALAIGRPHAEVKEGWVHRRIEQGKL